MKLYLLTIASILFASCSFNGGTNCDYKSANLYLYPFHFNVPYPMHLDRIKSNSNTRQITLNSSELINSICKDVMNLEILNEETIKTFDSRLVVELKGKGSEIQHIAVHSTKEIIFFANIFYKCDNDCQKEIVEPLLRIFNEE